MTYDLHNLSSDKKKWLLEKYAKIKNKPKAPAVEEEEEGPIEPVDISAPAGLVGLPIGVLGSVGMTSMAGPRPELQDNHLKELIQQAGLTGKINIDKPTEKKLPFFLENAYFRNYSEDAAEELAKNKPIGEIASLSKRLFKPGVMAHELGHANIHANKGFVNFLQRKLYGPTLKMNQTGLGMLPAHLAYNINKEEDSAVKGGLKGGLIGALANAGVLIPEFEASRRGIKYLMRTSMSRKEKLLNSLNLLPAYLTYLGGTAGPAALTGAFTAYQNKKNKEQKNKKL
jgi:hypothetical protein